MADETARHLFEAEKLLPGYNAPDRASAKPLRIQIEKVSMDLLRHFRQTAECRYFTAFYNISVETFHFYSIRHLSKYSCPADPQEIANKMYMILFERLLAPGNDTPLDYLFPWCYKTMQNLVREEMRSLQKNKPLIYDISSSDSNHSQVDLLIAKENRSTDKKRLEQILQILYSKESGISKRDRRIMRLFYLEGRSMKQISTIMQLAKANVGVILMRARKRITKRFSALSHKRDDLD